MPLTPPTLTRLNPSAPLLWRDERTLQIGDDEGLRIEADAEWVEPLLSRLRSGFRRGAFDVIAHAAGAPRDAARALLARLEPELREDPATPRPAWVESAGATDGRSEYRMRESLIDEGVTISETHQPPAVAVVLVRGAAAALQFASYLREDVPHLPVSFEQGRVTIGPLVIPGSSPCLACRDANATASDPAWPLLHSQLIGRDPGLIRAAQVAEAGRLVAMLLANQDPAHAQTVRISADGQPLWRSALFHEECQCRGPWFPSQRGTAMAPAPLDLPTLPRTMTAFAQHG